MTAKFIDVTVPLSPDLPTYPGDTPVQTEPTHRIADGGPYNVTRLTMGTHAGTHVDAPRHFLTEGGAVDELSLDILIGKALLAAFPGRDAVTRADLQQLDLTSVLRLLIRTRNSGSLRQGRLEEDAVYLDPEAARYLVQQGIKLVGWDSLSVDKWGSTDYASHHALLSGGVVVVEGLDLSQAEPGYYDLVCLPLRVAGGDGSPARVILKPRP
jgi:arylformamidase